MSVVSKSALRSVKIHNSTSRATVVPKAHARPLEAAVAFVASVGLLTAAPAFAVNGTESSAYEAQLRAAIQARKGTLPTVTAVPEVKETQTAPAVVFVPAPEAAPAVLITTDALVVEEAAAPVKVESGMSAQARADAIRAEAIAEAEQSALMAAEASNQPLKPAVTEAPAAGAAADGNNTAVLAVGALAVLAFAGAAAANNASSSEAASTPSASAASPAPAAPAAPEAAPAESSTPVPPPTA